MTAIDRLSKTQNIVSPAEWLEARRRHLAREKALTRLHDEVVAERGKLPWVRIAKRYVFDGPLGKVALADLFAGRSQLFVCHFMFGPGWEEGCVGCSFLADHIDGARQHVEHHDLSFAAVSRAPIHEIELFRERMGWKFQWVSSFESDFNYDFHVSFTEEEIGNGKVFYNYEMTEAPIEELPGSSVFVKTSAGEIYHTYSAFGRGDENLLGAYHLLEATPLGRNESGPEKNLTDWVRHHDRYDDAGRVAPTGRYEPLKSPSDCCSNRS